VKFDVSDAYAPIRSLPRVRLAAIAACALALVVADGLQENPYVDPDALEFALTLSIGLAAIGLAIRDRAHPGDVVRWGWRLVATSVSLAVAVVAAEYATRVLYRDVTTAADNRGYFTRRWYRSGANQLNLQGFRERAFAPVKAPGTYRIAVRGDSFTFGNGIRAADRFTDLLQARLPANIEVLNFATPGANTLEHFDIIKNVILPLQPDFILLQWFVNDVEGPESAGRPSPRPLLPNPALDQALHQRSALYNVLTTRWAQWQIAGGHIESYDAYLQRLVGNPRGPAARRARDELLEVIALARRNHVPIGMVLFPDAGADLGATYPFAYLHDRVTALCAEQGVTCVDLRGEFARLKDRRLLWANRLDHHPSARANEIAAIELLEAFGRTWMASPGR
jgi:hypothetical protein